MLKTLLSFANIKYSRAAFIKYIFSRKFKKSLLIIKKKSFQTSIKSYFCLEKKFFWNKYKKLFRLENNFFQAYINDFFVLKIRYFWVNKRSYFSVGNFFFSLVEWAKSLHYPLLQKWSTLCPLPLM